MSTPSTKSFYSTESATSPTTATTSKRTKPQIDTKSSAGSKAYDSTTDHLTDAYSSSTSPNKTIGTNIRDTSSEVSTSTAAYQTASSFSYETNNNDGDIYVALTSTTITPGRVILVIQLSF